MKVCLVHDDGTIVFAGIETPERLEVIVVDDKGFSTADPSHWSRWGHRLSDAAREAYHHGTPVYLQRYTGVFRTKGSDRVGTDLPELVELPEL